MKKSLNEKLKANLTFKSFKTNQREAKEITIDRLKQIIQDPDTKNSDVFKATKLLLQAQGYNTKAAPKGKKEIAKQLAPRDPHLDEKLLELQKKVLEN